MTDLKTCSRPAGRCIPGNYGLLIALYLVVNAQILRKVSVAYIGILVVLEIVTVAYILFDGLEHLRSSLGRWHVAFILCSLSGAMQTIYESGVSAGAYACARFYLVATLVPAAAMAINAPAKMRMVFKYFIAIVCVGVASVAVQYVIGPIAWFAEPGERAGILRFGSILGSLPTIGGAVPLAIFAVLVLRMKWAIKLLLLLALGLGVMLSLSKGAVAGTALAFVLFLIMPGTNRKQGMLLITSLLLVLLAVAPLVASNEVLADTGEYIRALFEQDSTGRGGDVTMQASMVERWTSLPAQSLGWLYRTRGNVGVVTGGGFQMLGAALMPEEGNDMYFTSHDTYVDLVLVAGLPLLITFLMLVGGTLYVLIGQRGSEFFRGYADIWACTVGIMIIVAVAGMFSAGETYQPAIASLWCICTGVAVRVESDSVRAIWLKRMSSLRGIQANLSHKHLNIMHSSPWGSRPGE